MLHGRLVSRALDHLDYVVTDSDAPFRAGSADGLRKGVI
jgi:hypothetical protein